MNDNKKESFKTVKKRYLILDVIRIFAVGLVVTAHILTKINHPLRVFFGIQDFYYVTFGGIGVTILLILSGMVLQLNYPKKVNYFKFVFKRLYRIYPLYFLVFFISVGLYFYRNSFACEICNFKNLLIGFFGFFAFIGKWSGPFLGASWFIGLIVCLYLLFPFLAYIIKRFPRAGILSLFVVSVVTRFVVGNFDVLPYRAVDWFPLSRVFEFSLGIYLAGVLPKQFLISLNRFNRISLPIIFFSEISFPMFLVHHLFINKIPQLIYFGFNIPFAITGYILIALTASTIVHYIVRRLIYQKKGLI